MAETESSDRSNPSGLPAESELLEMLYQCPVAIVQMDLRGQVTLMNAQAANLLMPRHGGAPVENLFDFLRPSSDALEVACQGHDAVQGSITHNLRVGLLGPDESSPDAWFSFDCVRIGSGQVLVAFQDITEVVHLEQASRNAQAAEALERGKSEVVTTILHDIGNAMTGVSTRVSALLGESSWGEIDQLEMLSELVANEAEAFGKVLGSERANALKGFCRGLLDSFRSRKERMSSDITLMHTATTHIQDVLTIQRAVVRDGHGVRRNEVELEEVLRDILQISHRSIEKRSIEVAVRVHPDVRQIPGDRTQITQLLLNVLKNAIEAHDIEGPDGVVRAERGRIDIDAEPSDGMVVLTVRDQGCGFDPSDSPELMSHGVTSKERGSGVGLSSCVSIVRAHGGDLRLQSAGRGLGAEVTIELPATMEGVHTCSQ